MHMGEQQQSLAQDVCVTCRLGGQPNNLLLMLNRFSGFRSIGRLMEATSVGVSCVRGGVGVRSWRNDGMNGKQRRIEKQPLVFRPMHVESGCLNEAWQMCV